MHMPSDFITTNLLFAGNESSLQVCNHRYNYAKGRNHRHRHLKKPTQEQRKMTALVKGGTC